MNIITKEMIHNNENIRRTIRENKCFYSVIDVFAYVTNSKIPKVYWKNLKGKNYILQSKVVKLKLLAEDNKYRLTDCAKDDIIDFIITHIPDKFIRTELK